MSKNKMDKQAFIELADKISTGVATDQELAQFNQWYQSFQQDGEEWLEVEWGEKTKVEAELLRRINGKILKRGEPRKSPVFPLRRIAAALVLFVIAAGGLYWYFSGTEKSSGDQIMMTQNDVEPGGDKAVLTLGDGSSIVLDEANTGLLTNEGNTSVNKPGEGLITYKAGTNANLTGGESSQPVAFNTISTPEGGQYKVVLPDETEVWLNALSSIKFPTQFTGKTREVVITGEVYFEVTKNEHQPFWVRSGDQVVKVLGTQFNIQAYPDEPALQTTLVEGSVIVETGGERLKITPGQQVINGQQDGMEIKEVDAGQVIAWKNGLFQFWNTDLQEIMRQLSRWYGVEVNYLNEPDSSTFTGFISRDVTISNVLRMLEEAGNVEFGLERNTVSVKIGNMK